MENHPGAACQWWAGPEEKWAGPEAKVGRTMGVTHCLQKPEVHPPKHLTLSVQARRKQNHSLRTHSGQAKHLRRVWRGLERATAWEEPDREAWKAASVPTEGVPQVPSLSCLPLRVQARKGWEWQDMSEEEDPEVWVREIQVVMGCWVPLSRTGSYVGQPHIVIFGKEGCWNFLLTPWGQTVERALAGAPNSLERSW